MNSEIRRRLHPFYRVLRWNEGIATASDADIEEWVEQAFEIQTQASWILLRRRASSSAKSLRDRNYAWDGHIRIEWDSTLTDCGDFDGDQHVWELLPQEVKHAITHHEGWWRQRGSLIVWGYHGDEGSLHYEGLPAWRSFVDEYLHERIRIDGTPSLSALERAIWVHAWTPRIEHRMIQVADYPPIHVPDTVGGVSLTPIAFPSRWMPHLQWTEVPS